MWYPSAGGLRTPGFFLFTQHAGMGLLPFSFFLIRHDSGAAIHKFVRERLREINREKFFGTTGPRIILLLAFFSGSPILPVRVCAGVGGPRPIRSGAYP